MLRSCFPLRKQPINIQTSKDSLISLKILAFREFLTNPHLFFFFFEVLIKFDVRMYILGLFFVKSQPLRYSADVVALITRFPCHVHA